MHALIIEDEVLIAALIEDCLRGLGFRTFDVAGSEDEAIALAARRCPDLITADDRLNEGSGIDAVLAICKRKPIPVVFIPGDTQRTAAAFPFAPILTKPFDEYGLAHVVADARRLARSQAAI